MTAQRSALERKIEKIERCEAAIGTIRAAYRAGDPAGAAEAFETLLALVDPILWAQARRLQWIAPAAAEEAHDLMYDTLISHLLSTTFPSLETGFGAYLRTMPVRALQKVSRKYRPAVVSRMVESLDNFGGEDDRPAHEIVEDPRAHAAFEEIAEREMIEQALAQLPAEERHVVARRAEGVENNSIARELGVSAATATRVYQRARRRLQSILADSAGRTTP